MYSFLCCLLKFPLFPLVPNISYFFSESLGSAHCQKHGCWIDQSSSLVCFRDRVPDPFVSTEPRQLPQQQGNWEYDRWVDDADCARNWPAVAGILWPAAHCGVAVLGPWNKHQVVGSHCGVNLGWPSSWFRILGCGKLHSWTCMLSSLHSSSRWIPKYIEPIVH